MKNVALRLYAKGAGVPLWRIAKAMGISDPTMTRLLREELTQEKEASIRDMIDRLREDKE